MILGALLPLALVVVLGVLVASVLIRSEIRKIKGLWETTGSKNPPVSSGKEPAVEGFYRRYDPLKQAVQKELLFINQEEIAQARALEREEDERWLAEITSRLDTASADDMELLFTAKAMLKRADDTKWNSAALPGDMKHVSGNQQKELCKQFIERELVKLNSSQ